MVAPPDALHPQLSRGGSLIAIAQAAKGAARFGAMLLMARLVSPAHFGVFAMAAVAYGWFHTVREAGLAAAGLQASDLHPRQADGIFWLLALAGIAAAAALAMLAPALVWFYRTDELLSPVLVLALTLLVSNLGAAFRLQLLREMRYPRVVAIETGSHVLSLLVSLSAATQGAGYWALVVGVVTLESLSTMGFFCSSTWRPGAWPGWLPLRDLLRFAGAVSTFNLANYAAQFADQFLIGKWFGPLALGLYGRAAQIASLPGSLFFGPLTGWMMHALSRLRAQPEEFRAFFHTVVGGLLVLCVPAGVLLALDPEACLRVVFGPAWLEAAPFLRPLGGALALLPLAFADVWVLLACAASRRLAAWTATKTIVILSAVLFSRTAGPEGVAWAVAFISALLGCAGSAVLRSISPIGPRDYATLLWRPMLLTLFWITLTQLIGLPSGLHRLGTGVLFFSATAVTWPALRERLRAIAKLGWSRRSATEGP